MGDEGKTKELEPTLDFICKHCGNKLDPRKFEFDGETVWGIFDNCEPFDKQMLYPTLNHAIVAFNYVPEELDNIEDLIQKYTHG